MSIDDVPLALARTQIGLATPSSQNAPVLMKRILPALLATVALSGCGGIDDHVTTHRFSIHAHHPAIPVNVSIGGAIEGEYHDERELVTDEHGDASTEFRTMGAAGFPLIPHRPKPPTYLLRIYNQRFEIARGAFFTRYRWIDNHWQTDVTVPKP